LIVCSAIWIWWRWSAGPDPDGEGSFLPNLPVALVTFVLTSLLLNSRFGYAVSEGGAEMLLLAYTWLRFDALQGLFRLITRFFRQVTQMVEYVLYVVDERLRFRGGEGRINMAARGVMAAIWFPIGYLARFYYTLLLEPTLNPVKLPLSSLAFKFFVLMPWYLALLNPNTLSADVARHTGSELVAILVAWVIVLPTVWLLPGIVAFFLWEMQENWRLFRANRRAKVGPVAVGNHGEPMLQLLRPGLHSGTIPRLYRQLRHAELAAYHDGDWRPARTYRLNLEEVAQSVRVFIERELLALITPTADWPRGPLSVGPIELSCNRIRIELRHPERTKESLWLTFEERAGRLIGALQGPGWLTDLTAEQARVTAAGLAWLFKIVGVDLLGGRLDALMAPDLSGPAVALGRPPLLLLDHSNRRMPVPADGNGVANASMPDTSRLLAFQVPLTWEQWVEYWDGHSVRANGQAAPSGADRA
jgi:hypothetical protein